MHIAEVDSLASDVKKKLEFKDGKSVFVICILIEKFIIFLIVIGS